MYITINDIKGSKTIDLSYPIHPTAGLGEARKEIAVVSMHISDSQILLHRSIEVLLKMGKKIVLNKGVYMDKELNSLKSQMLDSHNDVLRTNKLEGITKMIISLNKLDNSDNLEDCRPSNALLTYYVTSSERYTLFKPQTPRYALNYGEIVSLTLRIMDQNNNIITDGLETTVVLHIR